MVLLHIVFFAIIIFLIVLLCVKVKTFVGKKRAFYSYLVSINDRDTLYNCGFINEYKRENQSSASISV